MFIYLRYQTQKQKKILKYLISGGSAFLAEYSIFLFLFYVLIKNNIVLANMISYVSGFLVSFLLNRSWVFKSANHRYKLQHQATMYVALGILNLVISTIAIKILHNYLPGYAAKIVTVVAIAAWNFVVYQKLLFRDKEV